MIDDDIDDDDYDNRRNNSKSSKQKKSKKKHSIPNVVSPAAKAAKTGTRLIFKILNMIFKSSYLNPDCSDHLSTGIYFRQKLQYIWQSSVDYGREKLYITGISRTAGVLIFYEVITFLLGTDGTRQARA